MLVNNRVISMPGSLPAGADSSTGGPPSWAETSTTFGDTIQFTRLGGVLNALRTDASQIANRITALGIVVRNKTYSIDGVAVGRKLMSEMVRRYRDES